VRPHIYLDWNATTPPHEAVLEAMRAAASVAWANPASVHGPGRRARAFVEEAREAVAALVGLDPRDTVLTSGGTEANNLALALPFGDRVAGAGFGSPKKHKARTRPDAARRGARPSHEREALANAGRAAGLAAEAGAGARLAVPESAVANAGRAAGLAAEAGAGARLAVPESAADAVANDSETARPPGLVVSRIEHPSIVRMAEELGRRGVVVAWVEPDASGVVTAAAFAEAVARLREVAEVRLLVLQAVNHETGVIQPVAEVAQVARACGALLHVDAVQAVGRLRAETWVGADMVSVAAHKIRGPKGVGALCTRPGLKVRPLLFGGAQERGVRPGTQDPAACAGFAVAARRAAAEGPAAYARVAELRDRLEQALLSLGAELGVAAVRNGEAPRAPHVSNLSWPGWRGDELCAALDLEGVAVSSGSACSAGTAEPSPVITAMAGTARAASAVRVSLGEETTAEEADRALEAFRRVLARR
jgi:cysteine desulfurase